MNAWFMPFFLFHGEQMHNDAGSCVLAVVDALVGFHKH
jgi:hypothetical protein